jgi:hypothetical protein
MADLLSKTTYKQAKAISSTKDDERLDIIIPAVSSLVKAYCGNSFIDYAVDPLTEYASIDWATNQLMLEECPVLAISEVWVRSSPAEDYTQLDVTEFVLDKRTDTLNRISYNWPLGIESVKVLYNAGYSEVPAALVLALVDLTAYYMKEEYKSIKSIASSTITNVTTSSLAGNMDFPDHIKRVLDMYRQI